MSQFIEGLEKQLTGKRVRIVFPEGNDRRVLEACTRFNEMSMIHPVVLGRAHDIKALAKDLKLSIDSLEIIDPEDSSLTEGFVESFVERRKGKVTRKDAQKLIYDVNYFGTMLVYGNHASGLVSGAAHSTADTVRPALQIIKTKPGVTKTSGVFFLRRESEIYVMADCAINPTLSADEMAEVAVQTAKTSLRFGVEPRVACLSFSTKGSAKTEESERVALAAEKAQQMLPDVVIDGELQFDAAFVESVARSKAPDSPLKGKANVFIFPSLEAGNIGYKIAQRLGGFEAYGPILQGLNAPVNDLSRGCTTDEVYNLALFTACQSLGDA